MTVLSAAQSAMARLVGRRPAAVVSSIDEMEVEITALAQEAAVDIVAGNDWQVLIKQATLPGTGLEALALPDDYLRMVQGMGVSSPQWPRWFLRHAGTLDEWTVLKAWGYDLVPGWWLIMGDQFHVYPTLTPENSVNFYYVTKNIFTDAGGAPKVALTADTDTFVIDERLLTLSLIWRWKQMKQMEYAEDLRLYEDALSQLMTKDKGARVVRSTNSRMMGNVRFGYPWSLGG